MTDRKAMQKAFEIIGVLKPDNFVLRELQGEAWDALRQALAQPEQEPPKREWVGLTGIEFCRLKVIHIPIYSIPILDDYLNFYRAIENELKNKNTTNQ